MALSSAAYLEQLQALQPPGAAWTREPDSDRTRTLAGLAEEFARVDGRGEALILEADPRYTVEMLTDWERLYQIIPPPGASNVARVAMVVFRFLEEGDIKRPALVARAAAAGYTIRIDDYIETMAEWLCADDELLEEPWRYFEAGCAMAGDYLAQEDPVLPWIWEVVVTGVPDVEPTPGLEDLLNEHKPGHVQLNFTYL